MISVLWWYYCLIVDSGKSITVLFIMEGILDPQETRGKSRRSRQTNATSQEDRIRDYSYIKA
ncbi:Protein of unknown function [Bacillus thuringiensis]|uniref:Uncharacterized protein n=1 Tax=Bacillus thuringiensis TaxID=1428 RepID=A0A1C4E1U6_BACTU|nr:Protein of unknown function [Bacillus thuringiensis]